MAMSDAAPQVVVASTPQAPAQQTVLVREPETPKAAPDVRFTAEHLEKARQDEKDKLYPRIAESETRMTAMEAEIAQYRAEREALDAEKARVAAEAEAVAKAQAEADMSTKQLIEAKQSEWESRFADFQAERDAERAALEKEREYSDLRAYIQEKVREAQDDIAPVLLDFVTGNSREEVDQSIETMKAKSSEIIESVKAHAPAAPVFPGRGVSTASVPGAGPAENETGFRQLTAKDIKNMSLPEYAKYRSQLLGGAANNTQNRGMFG